MNAKVVKICINEELLQIKAHVNPFFVEVILCLAYELKMV